MRKIYKMPKGRISVVLPLMVAVSFASASSVLGQVVKHLRGPSSSSPTTTTGTITPITDESIHDAVKAWCNDSDSAADVYGHISDWDTSEVTDMSELLTYCSTSSTFDEDLSKWKVLKVVSFRKMFDRATSFTSDLSAWNVSQSTTFYGMFHGASSFTSDLSAWDVSQGTILTEMFMEASSFNSDLSSWNVSSVQAMDNMFKKAIKFDQHLCWDISRNCDTEDMFINTDGACINQTCGRVFDSTLYC